MLLHHLALNFFKNIDFIVVKMHVCVCVIVYVVSTGLNCPGQIKKSVFYVFDMSLPLHHPHLSAPVL